MATINVIWPEAQLIVVCIPKVANSAIKHALLQSMGYDIAAMTLGRQLRLTPWAAPQLMRSYIRKRVFGRAPGRRYAWHSVHTTPLLRGVQLDRGYRDYLKVGVVRHPLDRLVSCYRSKIVWNRHRRFQAPGAYTQMPFAEFVDLVSTTPDSRANRHFQSQHCFLYHVDGSLAVDRVLRFESLAEDWRDLQQRVFEKNGARLADLPAVNVTQASQPEWPSYYDASLWEQAGRRYARDLALFGYDSV